MKKKIYDILYDTFVPCADDYVEGFFDLEEIGKFQLSDVSERDKEAGWYQRDYASKILEENGMCIAYSYYGYEIDYWKGNCFDSERHLSWPEYEVKEFCKIPPRR